MKVAVIGAGYWGMNLVRNFKELGVLDTVCEVPEWFYTSRFLLSGGQHRFAPAEELDKVLQDPTITAVVIATPAVSHYSIAKAAMLAGKHVMVEKPMAMTVVEGEDLVEVQRQTKVVFMVGHLLHYHPMVQKLKDIVWEGHLGRVNYIYSNRASFGKLRTEENILWSFAPHDISLILNLLGQKPYQVKSHGAAILHEEIHDVTLTWMAFASGARAHIFVSWLHPFKEQRFVVVGDKGMAVFDDTKLEHKLIVYKHRIEWKDLKPEALQDIKPEIIPDEGGEPLRIECEHFLSCIEENMTPVTNEVEGLRVLRVLERCQRSLEGKDSNEIAQ